MNALKILFVSVLIFYLTWYDFSFWKYFLTVLIPYYLITQILMVDQRLNTPKKKGLIAMWSAPGDPQIYGTQKLNITKVEEYLKEYSMKVEDKIGITIFIVKVFAKMMEKYTPVNGNVIFGKFVPKSSVDISVMVGVDKGHETELITIKSCEKLSLEEISTKIQEKKKAIEEKTEETHNRRLFFAKLLPTFILSPFVRILSYLSACGVNLSWLWLPEYAYGTCIINNLGKLGIDGGFLPIPPYSYAPFLISISKKKKKKSIDPDTMTLKENTYIYLHFTLDHRYLDGSLAAKIASDIEKITLDPTLL